MVEQYGLKVMAKREWYNTGAEEEKKTVIKFYEHSFEQYSVRLHVCYYGNAYNFKRYKSP